MWLRERFLTFEDTHSFCSAATSHTHCNAVTLGEAADNRTVAACWLSPHKHTENSVHAAVLPVSFPVWRKAMRSRAEARVHSPSVAPEPGILSPLLSCYLDRCCIYVFTWCLYDIYTYFLGMWGLTFTVPRAALGSDTEQAAEVWGRLLSALATGQGETVAGRGGSGSKWRKPGRRKPYDVNQCCGNR